MKTGRGKRVALVTVAVGLVVLIATGYAVRDRIREEYWLYRWRAETRDARRWELAEKLVSVGERAEETAKRWLALKLTSGNLWDWARAADYLERLELRGDDRTKPLPPLRGSRRFPGRIQDLVDGFSRIVQDGDPARP